MDWKETVTNVSDRMFPGLAHKLDDKFESLLENEVLSNLPLQMSLYFNAIFAPFWVSIIIIYLNDKYSCFNELYRFIVITIVVAIFIVEFLRLYLGYEGNLKDKIPELAGFWMLSVLLQFPMQGFLLFNPYFHLDVMEIVVQSIMFILLLSQVISGYFALKYTAAQQAIHYRIMKSKSNISQRKKDVSEDNPKDQ